MSSIDPPPQAQSQIEAVGSKDTSIYPYSTDSEELYERFRSVSLEFITHHSSDVTHSDAKNDDEGGSNYSKNDADFTHEILRQPCSFQSEDSGQGHDDNREAIFAEAFQNVMEVCFASFIAVFCPPSPSSLLKDSSHRNDRDSADHHNEQSFNEEEPTGSSTLSAKESPSTSSAQELHVPVPTVLVEKLWSQVLNEYWVSHPDQRSVLHQLMNSTNTSAAQLVREGTDSETEVEVEDITLSPLIDDVKGALIRCELIVEFEAQDRLHPSSPSSGISTKSLQIHQDAFQNDTAHNFSQEYFLNHKSTSMDATQYEILKHLQWNDMFVTIIERTVTTVIDVDDTDISHVEEPIPSRFSGGALPLDVTYAIESLSVHYFRLFSISLVVPVELANTIEKSYVVLESFNRHKERFMRWMASPQFVHHRIWLHVHSLSAVDESELEVERQLLENGLLYLDACHKLLVVMLQGDKSSAVQQLDNDDVSESKQDGDKSDPYQLFLEMHSTLESQLKKVWEAVEPYMKDSAGAAEVTDSMNDAPAEVEGTLILRKRRYERIIQDYRKRKSERAALLLQGKTSAQAKSHQMIPFAEQHARLSSSNAVIPGSADAIEPTNATPHEEVTLEQGFESSEVNVDGQGSTPRNLNLKIAIGVGRIVHSVAVSLGRSTIELSAGSHSRYATLATQLEMDLYKVSLSIFESIAQFQENHAELQSPSAASSTGLSAPSASTEIQADLASHYLRSSDTYVQNQLDIADTLSCMAFVQDTKLQSYEDALSSYKRAVDIYSFFMGSKSEPVEKALYNIAILHVAIAAEIEEAIGRDGRSEDGVDDQEQRKIVNHYEESLESWKRVLECQEYNERPSSDESIDADRQFFEMANTFHYMGKVYGLINNEEEMVACFEMGLSTLQQNISQHEDALELKCTLISDLTDTYFDRGDYARIVALLSNDALQEITDYSSRHDEISKGPWYCYVLGKSQLETQNDELALTYFLRFLDLLEVSSFVPQISSGDLTSLDMQDVLSHFCSVGLKLNFGSPLLTGGEKMEVLDAAFQVAVLLTNQVKKHSSEKFVTPTSIFEFARMFEAIRVQVASMIATSTENETNKRGSEYKDLQLLEADALFYMGDLYVFSGNYVDEAADMLNEALHRYQELQRENLPQVYLDASLSLTKENSDHSKSPTGQSQSIFFDMKLQRTLADMGFVFHKLELHDDSMQCYKSALEIQKRLAVYTLETSKNGSETADERPSENPMPCTNVELKMAIADTIYGIGFLYADGHHEHTSKHMALRYLEEAAVMKQQLVSDESISMDNRNRLLRELVSIYETSLTLTGVELDLGVQWGRARASDSAGVSLSDQYCQLLFRLGNVYGLVQRFTDSAASYQRCLVALKSMHREDDLVYGSILHNYGIVLEKLGGTDNAVLAQQAYETSLTITEKHLGKSHPAVGDTLHGIGAIIVGRSLSAQYNDALLYLQRALKIRVASVGANHINVSHTLHTMAQIHFSRGEFGQAIQQLEKSLQIRRRVHGSDHISVADTLHLLAESHIQRKEGKDSAVAMSCFREAARIRELNVGIQDLATLSTLHRMAFLHAMNGDTENALELYNTVLPLYRSAMSSSKQDCEDRSPSDNVALNVARVLTAIGIIRVRSQRNEDAKECFQEALDILRKLKPFIGDCDSDKISAHDEISTLHCLAVVLDKLQHSNDALKCYSDVLAVYHRDFGTDSLLAAHVMSRMGSILVKQLLVNECATDGRAESSANAVQHLKEALRIYAKELGETHEIVGDVHFALACASANIIDATNEENLVAVHHFFLALAILEQPGAAEDSLNDTDAQSHQAIQSEWNFEILRRVDKMERMKTCLQQILHVSESLNVTVISRQETANILFKLGNICAQEGKSDEAILHYERTLKIQRKLDNEDHLDLSNTLHNLGNALVKKSEYELALSAYEESLALAKAKLGTEHEAVAETINCIGNVCRKVRQLDRAEECYTETLRLRRNLFGDRDFALVAPLLSLATIQAKRGEYHAAMDSFKDVLQISKLTSRNESLEVATALHGIANIHANVFAEYNKAAACLEGVLRTRRAIYEATDVRIADAALELGMVYDRMGDYDSAKERYEEALDLYCSVQGEESLQVAKVLNNIGLVHDAKNQLEAAADSFQAALRIYKIHSIDNHVDLGDCCHNLGVACNKMSMLDDALSLYNDALAAYSQSLDESDAKLAKTLHAKGVILSRMRRRNDALTCFQRACEIMSEKMSIESEEIAETKYCIGKLLLEMGDEDGARAALENALQVKAKPSGNNSLSVASILYCLGLIHAGKKEFNDAVSRFRYALKIQNENLGDMNDVAETNYRLGCALLELGTFRDALGHFDEALRIKEGAERPNQLEVSNILFSKGQAHSNVENEIGQAIECFQRSLVIRQKMNKKDDLTISETLVGLGRSFESRQDFGAAIKSYNDAMTLYHMHLEIDGVEMEVARLAHLIGTAKYHLGQYDDAILELKAALQKKICCFGEDHVEVSSTLHSMGLAFLMEKKFDDALQCFEKAAEIRRVVDDDDEVILIKQSIAEVYVSTGRAIEGLELLKEVTSLRESVDASESSKRLNLMRENVKCYDLLLDAMLMSHAGTSLEIADVYTKKGTALGFARDYHQSKLSFKRALEIQIAALGPNHLSVASTLHNVGVAETETGDLIEAETHLERSAEILQATLNDNNEDVAETLYCLANVKWKLSNYEEALRLYHESASVLRSLSEGGSLNLARTLYQLGFAYETLKEFRKANACYKECLKIRKSRLGENHLLVAAVLFSIGNIHNVESEFEKAIDCYRASLEIKQQLWRQDDLSIANTIHNLAGVHDAIGEGDQARLLYFKALSIYRKVLGSSFIPEICADAHPAPIRDEIDDTMRQGIEQALDKYFTRIGDRPDYAETYFNIASLFEQLSDFRNAKLFYAESANRYRTQAGKDHLNVANASYRMGHIYVIWKMHNEALDCFDECLRIRKIHLGEIHEDVEELLDLMGGIYHTMGDFRRSVSFAKEALIAKESRIGNVAVDETTALFRLATSSYENADLSRALTLFEEALSKQRPVYGDDHLFIARTLHSIGNVLREMGQTTLALDRFEAALRIFGENTGADSLEFANTAFVMGILFCDLRRFDDSMSMYSRSLKIRQQRLGLNHVHVAQCYNNMGVVQYEMSEYEKAVSFFEQSLQITEAVLGREHEEVGYTYSGLANAYRELGRPTKASACFDRTLQIQKATLGEDHLDVGATLYNYGVFLAEDCDNLIESIKCLNDALRIQELNLGRDSHEVSDTLFQLSEVYRGLGKFDEAIRSLNEAIRLREFLLLADTPRYESSNDDSRLELLASYNSWIQLTEVGCELATDEQDLNRAEVIYKKGNIHMQLSQNAEAIKCFDQALTIQIHILGPYHLAVSNTLHNLGSAELRVDDLERAGHHLEESMMVRRRIIDGDDLELADTMHNLATVYRKKSEFDKSIHLFDESSQIKRTYLGGGHLSLADTLNAMGAVFVELHDHDKAMRCYMECLRIRRLKLGPDHVSVANVLFSIGNIHKARSESERAIQVYRETLRIRRLLMEGDSIEIASVLHNIAAALDSKKEYEEALYHYEESLHIYETVLDRDDLKVATTLLNIGGLLAEIEDYVDALECYQRALSIRRKKIGENEREVADVILSIGMAEEKLNLDESAMGHYKRALQIFGENDGFESEAAGRVLHGMAVIFAKRSECEKALKCGSESVRMRTTAGSDMRDDVADTLYLMGTLHQLTNDLDEALRCFTQCEQVYRRRLGDDHISVGNALFQVASITESKGEISEAMKLYQESLRVKRIALGDSDLEVGTLYYKLGCLHKMRSEHAVASKLLQQALRIQRLHLGQRCIEVAQTQLTLGIVYESSSTWELALHSYEDALGIYQELNADPLVLAKILSLLGGVRDEMQDSSHAIKLYDEAIAFYQQGLLELDDSQVQRTATDENLRKSYLDFADTSFNLGAAFDRECKLDNALQYYRAALEIYVKLIGKDCVDAAKTLNSMGVIYAKQYDYELSLRLLKEALRVRELFFGNDHLDVASTLFGLGVVHDKLSEYPQALECYTRALRIRKAQLGDKNVDAAQTLANMGIVYGNMAQFDKAIEQWERVLDIYSKCGVDNEDPAVAAVHENIAVAKELAESHGSLQPE